MRLVRSIEGYANCSPNAVASGSKAQMMYFVEDAKKDIATLHARVIELEVELASVRRGLMPEYPPDYPGGFDGPTGAE